MKNLKEIFKNKIFAKLFFANFTSQMGSVIGVTAFMFYLLDRFSDQPIYASITELMYSLPTLAIFLVVGVVADRFDRQKIAYYCDAICVVLSAALIFAIWYGWMPLIFAALFLRSAVQKFFFPAESGIMQGILKKEDYAVSAGLNQMVMSIFMLFGNGLGILAYWLGGIYGALIIDGITFAISALLIKSCTISTEARLPNGKHRMKDLNIKFVMKDFKEGMFYIIKNKLLISLIVGFFVFGVVNGGFSVMPVFILKYKLAPDSYEQLSIILGAAFGIGALIGGVVASTVVQKVKFHHLIVFGIIIAGAFTVLSSFAPNTWSFMALVFLSSFGIPFANIGIGGWMPSIIDPKMMGRVQGWIGPLMMLSQSATLGFIAVSFPKVLTVEMLYWIVGGCMMAVGVFYAIILPKYIKGEKEVTGKAAAVSS
ncbi:MFS transporter [Falsibacillus pallidus]|uniref:MFS transporter n=1 Tax=Falsibacillus pallidus TaxID=493781 RepID=A0A370GW60_9BACI|nr:MFS transporter [Falsibacillus pallidus]RDI47908.1 MFS transporter [Falsibacillus pallidus]